MKITEITTVKQQITTKIRLAAYCRVSSDSADQLHSFAAQIRYYSEYTAKHPEYELVDIYADEGLTGTEMKKRDEGGQNHRADDPNPRNGQDNIPSLASGSLLPSIHQARGTAPQLRNSGQALHRTNPSGKRMDT